MSSSSKTVQLFKYGGAYLPVIIWAGVIFAFSAQSSLPGFTVSTFDFVFKKSAHMFMFGVLYWLLWRAQRQTVSPATAQKYWLFPLTLVFLYALIDELHQSFTPTRSPSLRDVGFDLLGALLAFLRINRYI